MPSVTLYKMPQVIQISETGLSVHAVVNRTDFNLFRGVTNEIEFLLKNADRKPSNLLGKTLSIFIVDERTNTVVVQTGLTTISETRGHCRLTLSPSDVAGLDNGSYRYSITETVGDKQTIVFTDQNRSFKGYLEVFDGPIPNPNPSLEISKNQFVSETWGTPLQAYYVAGPFPGAAQVDNRSGQHTLALYCDNFSGQFWIDASLESGVPNNDADWFPVMDFQMTEQNGVKSVQFTGSYMWVRFYYQPAVDNDGEITKALLKN